MIPGPTAWSPMLLPLHISLSDTDGLIFVIGCFAPFLMVAGLVVYLRIHGVDEDTDASDRDTPA